MSTDLNILNSALAKLGQEKVSAYPDTTTARGIALSEQYPKVLKKLLRSHPWNFAMKRTKVSISNAPVNFSEVSVANNTFSETAHGYVTGQKVQVSTSGVLPTGLAASTDYYLIKSSVDLFKLASSLALAIAGTAIDITAQGSGDHTITPQDKVPEFVFDFQATLPSDYVRAFKVTSDARGGNNITHEIENGKILTNYESFYMAYTGLVTDASLFPDDFSELFALALAAETAYQVVQNTSVKASLDAEFKLEFANVRFNDAFETTQEPMQVDYYLKARF